MRSFLHGSGGHQGSDRIDPWAGSGPHPVRSVVALMGRRPIPAHPGHLPLRWHRVGTESLSYSENPLLRGLASPLPELEVDLPCGGMV